MLSLRSARQSAYRLSRTTSLLPLDIHFPHAESSSAPSRRHASSAPSEGTPGVKIAPTHDESVHAMKKERKQSKANPRLRKQALANARRLNEAIRSEKSSSSPPQVSRPPTDAGQADSEDPSSSFWSDLLSRPSTTTDPSSPSPTLEDLMAKKPVRPPPDPWHPKYRKLYQKLTEDLDHAFVLKQLKSFCQQLGLYTRVSTTKVSCIKKILKAWGWVEPKDKDPDVKKPYVYDLPPAELFLFLRETDLIHEMTKGYYRMDLAVVPAHEAPQTPFGNLVSGDENRMVLVAMGKVEPLVKLTNLIQERKKAIQTIEFSAQEINGLSAPVGLLQTYRITAMSTEAAEDAKRLLAMASLRINSLPSHRSLDVLLPTPRHFQTQPLRLSLYPFIPSTSESLPWSISSDTNSQALFRLRKVTEWNSKPAIREIDHKNEKLYLANYMNLAPSNVDEASPEGEKEFRNLIQGLTAKNGKKRLKVIFGNMVFPKQGRLSIFDNPLPGQWPVETLRHWISRSSDEGRKPIFTPSLTHSAIQFPFTSAQTTEIRRIRYRSLCSSPAAESRFVEFTYTKPTATQDNWQDRLGAMLDDLEKQIGLEDGVVPTVKSGSSVAEEEAQSPVDSLKSESPEGQGVSTSILEQKGEDEPTALSTEVTTQGGENGGDVPFDAVFGVIRESDLFIPDRPNDARIVSTSTVSLPSSKIPEPISELFNQYPNQEKTSLKLTSPPSRVMIKDEEYLLEYDEKVEITEEVQEIEVGGNTLRLCKRSCKVVENGLDDLSPLVYSELECGSNSDGTLPTEFYRELAYMTRDVGPDAGALKRGNILSGLGMGVGGEAGSSIWGGSGGVRSR
uniref:Uncharacterized protein n=1 Tax=Kwoniella bestiolae CBS 10118 TaxID=1296100 RepID=A0A1B9FSK2_9TREE|nr:hypothetical protein I302_08536 [Kwoniella bestiolae CBS 10118]OCF21757.1 hypothetical protein I302_08536 [Kwoniella bestiolae CBS 10118]